MGMLQDAPKRPYLATLFQLPWLTSVPELVRIGEATSMPSCCTWYPGNGRVLTNSPKSKVRVKYPVSTFFVISRKEAINGRR